MYQNIWSAAQSERKLTHGFEAQSLQEKNYPFFVTIICVHFKTLKSCELYSKPTIIPSTATWGHRLQSSQLNGATASLNNDKD